MGLEVRPGRSGGPPSLRIDIKRVNSTLGVTFLLFRSSFPRRGLGRSPDRSHGRFGCFPISLNNVGGHWRSTMLRTHLAVTAWVAIFSIPLVALGACQAEPTTAEPVVALAPEYAGSGPQSGPGDVVIEILDEAIASEIMAHFTYLNAADEFGIPFTRIRDAELRHVEAVQHLYVKRGLEAPPLVEPEGVATFETRLLACEAGVATELAVVALYDELVPLVPADVARVFLQLQSVSEANHLEAFLACS